MIERISGPFHGYHIAAYACPMGELGTEYLGHYKISLSRPRSFLDAGFLYQGSCEELSANAADALRAAESSAAMQIAFLEVSRAAAPRPEDTRRGA